VLEHDRQHADLYNIDIDAPQAHPAYIFPHSSIPLPGTTARYHNMRSTELNTVQKL
jgi:hypothetical protein